MTSPISPEARMSGTARQRVYLVWLTMRNLMTTLAGGLTESQMSQYIAEANETRKSLRLPYVEQGSVGMNADIIRWNKAVKGFFS